MARSRVPSKYIQLSQGLSGFLACWVIANPEVTPVFVRPYVVSIRSGIAACLGGVFGGWWPFVVGEQPCNAHATCVTLHLRHPALSAETQIFTFTFSCRQVISLYLWDLYNFPTDACEEGAQRREEA